MEQGVTQQQFTKAIGGITEMLHFIMERMVTKDELEELRKEFKGDVAEFRTEMNERLRVIEKDHSLTLINHERRISLIEHAIA